MANPKTVLQNDYEVTGVLYADAGVVGGQTDPVTVIPGDGAIAVVSGTVSLTKGSAAAITIVAPVAGAPSAGGQDGVTITVIAETAFAHVITCASVGFNGKGASGTATWAAAKGNGITLEARGGQWWVIGNIGVTIA